MNKYQFNITPDGKDTVTQEFELSSIDNAKEKFHELLEEHCDKPTISKEFMTTSKPCSFSVFVWDEIQTEWEDITKKILSV